MARFENGPGLARPIEAVPAPATDDPTWARLEDQIGWYERMSMDSRRWYKWRKLLELAVAAALPVVAALHSPVWVTGGLAALIVVLEGAQHPCISFKSTGSPTARPQSRSNTSDFCIWPRLDRMLAVIGTGSWQSGLRAWFLKSTRSGLPAIETTARIRRIARHRCAESRPPMDARMV
jgi:hypothetical protein